jgi:hypothetical protein
MMKFNMVIFSVFFSISLIAKEFSWPIDIYKENHLITSTFGESRNDHFHAGIDISGEDLPIFPIQDSRILYLDFHTMFSSVNRLPNGSGNQLWLDHGNGYWSGYYHLKKFYIPDNKFTISLNESFALTGNTGRSMGAHLHFFILQDYGKKIINPFMVLSKEIDDIPPVIESLNIIILDKDKESITTIIPDKENGLKLNGIYKFNHIYHKNFLKLKAFDYEEGINTITITAYDNNNNQTTQNFILNIKKEY